MLFMNKPKGNIPKIVTITNGLAKVTGKNITLGKLLARDNQYEVFEVSRDPESSHPKLVAQYSQEAGNHGMDG